MIRYNPPSTSLQAKCFGCQRHIAKVQDLMNHKQLLIVGVEMMTAKKDEQIQMLERQVANLKLQLALKSDQPLPEAPLSSSPNSSTMSDEELRRRVEVLTEVNKRLFEQLEITTRPAEPHPLDTWREIIDGNWNEKMQRMREAAISHCENLEAENTELKATLEVVNGNPLLHKTVESIKQMQEQQRAAMEALKCTGHRVPVDQFQQFSNDYTDALIEKLNKAMEEEASKGQTSNQ